MRRLLMIGWVAHLVGAGLALAYNLIVRSQLHQGAAAETILVAKVYLVLTSVLGAVAGRVLVRRLEAFAARRSGAALLRNVLWFPMARALVGTASWLLAIPVLAASTVHTVGHVHPIGFPHFVASIVIAWLVSTIYSSVCNLWVALHISRAALADDEALGGDQRVRRRYAWLRRFVEALPGLAAAVPLTALIMYFVFLQPLRAAVGPDKSLELYLVALMTVGGYGCYFCRWASVRMRPLLPS